MDMSKLPKLSETPKPPDNPPPTPPAPQPVQYARALPPAMQGEAFFSIAMGALLLFMFPRFLHWLLRPSTFVPFKNTVTGQVVPYLSTPEFWMDLGPVLFGVILIVEGLVIAFVRIPAAVMGAFLLTAAATAYNILYVFVSYPKYGLALVSFLAGVFGIYISMSLWKYARHLSGKPAPMT